jgi:calcineurin-like phosphoesterase family protein
MEAVIKIIEKVGEKFEVQTTGQMPEILDAIKKVVKKETKTIGEYDYSKLNTDEFFDIIKYIDAEILKSHYPRVSVLLEKLEQRRKNGWKLHPATEISPKALNEVKEEEDKKVSNK